MLQTTLARCGSAGCGQAYLYRFVMVCQRPWLRRKATHWSAARRNHPRQRKMWRNQNLWSFVSWFVHHFKYAGQTCTHRRLNECSSWHAWTSSLSLPKDRGHELNMSCHVFFHFFSSLSIKKDSLDLTRQKLEWHGAQLCVWEHLGTLCTSVQSHDAWIQVLVGWVVLLASLAMHPNVVG